MAMENDKATGRVFAFGKNDQIKRVDDILLRLVTKKYKISIPNFY